MNLRATNSITNDLPAVLAGAAAILRLGPLLIIPEERRARLSGVDLDLSATEFTLLSTLAASHDRPVSVGALVRAAGWLESTASLAYLDLYIRYLRDKLDDDPAAPRALLPVRRSGYMLVPAALAPVAPIGTAIPRTGRLR